MPSQGDPISAGLKKLFETVADEPIPDEFLSLLDRIDAERARTDLLAPPGHAALLGAAGADQ